MCHSVPGSPRSPRTATGTVRLAVVSALALSWAITAVPAQAQVSLTTLGVPYTQDFNVMASTGTSSTLPAGWAMSETGTAANATYTAGTGSGTTGDTYSFGSASAADRALGGLQSGSLVPTFGASFQNNTGVTIALLDISYFGEQWRVGTLARTDRIDFQISMDATSLTTGTWTDVDALDFTGPDTGGAIGARDGNVASFRTFTSFTIGSLSIAPAATFWIRWTDLNASGADDGLAADDFSLTPNTGPVPTVGSTWGAIKTLYR